MKVTGTTGPSAPAGGKAARSASGFSLGQPSATSGAAAPAASAAASTVADVSALMALQGVEGPLEKRRRAVKRGAGLLDRLDEMKMALLSGEADEATLDQLARTLREERPDDGDAQLNALLDQIDLRASVELAKAELRRSQG
jgi:Class II flagellar assembly regulator